MIRIVVGTWFKIALSHEQVVAWHVSRLEDAFEALFSAAGSPSGAALFSLPRDDGGECLYFTPQASALATRLLKANGGHGDDRSRRQAGRSLRAGLEQGPVA